jgi:hypothetical protein
MTDIKEPTPTIFELHQDLQLHPDSDVIEKGLYRLWDTTPYFQLSRCGEESYKPIYLNLGEFTRFMYACFGYSS